MSEKKSVPVAVCRERGLYFGKYKDPDNGVWRRIPGGAYPPEVNTREKATRCAVRWYEVEMAERALTSASSPRPADLSWADLCDAYATDIESRVRGAAATKHEAKTRALFLRRSPILSTRPVREHDDALALQWLRQLLCEPIGAHGEPRDALTVRNIARVLKDIYAFARRQRVLPPDRILPTESDEFRAEVSGALKEKAKLRKGGRAGCPFDTARKLVNCEALPPWRRLMRLTAILTGMAPGELHGLKLRHYTDRSGVRILDVRRQWTLPRKGFPAALGPLKTTWRARQVPVHPRLREELDAWIERGWAEHVGRLPSSEDFLFVDPDGKPFREADSTEFVADLRLAGCATRVGEYGLDIYSLRHTFASLAKRAGIPSDLRDRLLGHRPKDMKTMFYEDEDLQVLAAEVAKIDALIDHTAEVPEPGRPPTLGAAPTSDRTADPGSSLVATLVARPQPGSGTSSVSLMISAEEEGVEPPVPFRVRRFSKPLP